MLPGGWNWEGKLASLGVALLGARIGDKVTIAAPGGQTTPAGVPWSLQDDDNLMGGTNPDAQTAEVTAYLRMSQ